MPLTSGVELAEVNRSLDSPSSAVAEHITNALQHLPPARDVDTRQAVQQAILALEAAARFATGNPKLILSQAMPAFEEKFGKLQPAWRIALEKLYGFAGDEPGIRHALIEGAGPVSIDDARFMVVVCSAFANYLVARAAR